MFRIVQWMMVGLVTIMMSACSGGGVTVPMEKRYHI